MHFLRRHLFLTIALILVPGLLPAAAVTADSLNDLNRILGAIGDLENRKDPKCYATASRLEDFMYGTPLEEQARFRKIELQKNFVRAAWKKSSEIALGEKRSEVSNGNLATAIGPLSEFAKGKLVDVHYRLNNSKTLQLKENDIKQYSSIAYSLRAILGVQQELMLEGTSEYLPLAKEAITTLKNQLDVMTLAALQLADEAARADNRYRVSAEDLAMAWSQVAPAGLVGYDGGVAGKTAKEGRAGLSTIRNIAQQKIKSYEAYNNISQPVFLRNIQVYFARYRWPSDPEQSKSLKALFNEVLIGFTQDLYLGSQKLAQDRGHVLIRIEDVSKFAGMIIPHRVNEYEDAVFFPGLPRAEQIEIESYDMDAFRDSGLHWRYLQTVLDESASDIMMEPDPFAAELLVENIAQFGVLLLREAGVVASQSSDPALSRQHLEQAGTNLQLRVSKHAALAGAEVKEPTIASSRTEQRQTQGHFFQDVTAGSGVDFRHSSADWLSRLIRSYTVRDREVAVLAVPPAFGGAGIAAEDINGDDLHDLLLVGGKGNRLYLNMGQGQFRDISEQAGINWLRAEDASPGEPRQPIIADFDNDGLPDIFISYVNDNHRLYRNLGDGRFQDVSDRTGLGGAGLVAGPATAADFDNDGLLDIYIGYFGQYIEGIKPTLARRNFNGLPNQLFRNQGGMIFRNVTDASGVDNQGWTQALAHTDFDRDGWQDLIVGNDFGINAYYRNLGNGSFENVADGLGVNKPSYTMNVGISDLNDDLFPDVYISNIVTMDKDQKYVLPGEDTPMKFDARKMANMRVVEANDLFLSESRDGSLYAYRSSQVMGRGASSTGWAWGASFFDVDNDGDDDLYVVNGMNEFALYSSENPYYKDPDGASRNVVLPQSNRETNVFFINNGGKLHNVSERSGADLLGNSRAVAYLDMDQDGDQDMVLNNYHEKAVVYRNNAEQLENRWIKIKLIGNPKAGSNRDAIGARIIVTTEDGNRVWREIRGSEAYLTMHPKEQHIGLGKASRATVSVEWPNGERMEFPALDAGYRYVIDQASHSLGRKKTG